MMELEQMLRLKKTKPIFGFCFSQSDIRKQ